MLMQMRSAVESKLPVMAMLIVIAAGVCWLLYQIPPNLGRLPGIFLLVIGTLTIVLHRRIGQQTVEWARSMPAVVAKFWASGGQTGAQSLYLGIGIILVVSGSVLLMASL
jgi:hypothetical protein